MYRAGLLFLIPIIAYSDIASDAEKIYSSMNSFNQKAINRSTQVHADSVEDIEKVLTSALLRKKPRLESTEVGKKTYINNYGGWFYSGNIDSCGMNLGDKADETSLDGSSINLTTFNRNHINIPERKTISIQEIALHLGNSFFKDVKVPFSSFDIYKYEVDNEGNSVSMTYYKPGEESHDLIPVGDQPTRLKLCLDIHIPFMKTRCQTINVKLEEIEADTYLYQISAHDIDKFPDPEKRIENGKTWKVKNSHKINRITHGSSSVIIRDIGQGDIHIAQMGSMLTHDSLSLKDYSNFGHNFHHSFCTFFNDHLGDLLGNNQDTQWDELYKKNLAQDYVGEILEIIEIMNNRDIHEAYNCEDYIRPELYTSDYLTLLNTNKDKFIKAIREVRAANPTVLEADFQRLLFTGVHLIEKKVWETAWANTLEPKEKVKLLEVLEDRVYYNLHHQLMSTDNKEEKESIQELLDEIQIYWD